MIISEQITDLHADTRDHSCTGHCESALIGGDMSTGLSTFRFNHYGKAQDTVHVSSIVSMGLTLPGTKISRRLIGQASAFVAPLHIPHFKYETPLDTGQKSDQHLS